MLDSASLIILKSSPSQPHSLSWPESTIIPQLDSGQLADEDPPPATLHKDAQMEVNSAAFGLKTLQWLSFVQLLPQEKQI